MPILEGDIQIMSSQVLDDVPEGGGAATGDEIADGVSNNLFPDIAELDRVYGRVQLRKVFPSVRTEDTDRYSGANVIVVTPPEDPDVSCVLFSTRDAFDTRTEAANRIEAYLAQGPAYQGLLFANHIAGQMTVTIIQRVGAPVPAIGETLCIRKNEGLVTEEEQFVRVTDVESSVATFTDVNGDFQRAVVALSISDQLRVDFPGFEAARVDTGLNYTNKSRIYMTVVADAARYYGVKPLTAAADLGDFVVEADGIFSNLVPSSRAETAITDARMNQQQVALGSTGSAISRSLVAAFSPTANLFIGGGVLPGTLSVVRSGVTLTDDGGVLIQGGLAVGTVDYENGILSLSTDVWGGSSGTHTVGYTPAATPDAVTESVGIRVTAGNQRLTWVMTLDPMPQHGSLQISYMAQGRWYVLTDSGGGAIRGGDPSYGAGNLNYSTGTIALTLGALPDVGSAIIGVWAPEVATTALTANDFAIGMRFAHLIQMPTAIRPGTLDLSWNDGAARTAADDGNGLLTGDADGQVFYSDGRIYFSPDILPAPGTNITVDITEATKVDDAIATFGDGGSTWTTTLATPVREGSIEMAVIAQFPVRVYPGVDDTTEVILRVFDAAGVLYVRNAIGNLAVGTVDYVTGAVTITKSVGSYTSVQGNWANQTMLGDATPRIVYQGESDRVVTLTMRNGPAATAPVNPSWAWWAGSLDDAAFVRYASTDGSGSSTAVPMNSILLVAAVDLAQRPQPVIVSGRF